MKKKLILNEHFANYEHVKDACDALTKAVIREAMAVEDGTSDEEINHFISAYQTNNRKRIAEAVLEDAIKFSNNYFCRYEAHFYTCDEHGQVVKDTMRRFSTDNLQLALSKAASFYRHSERPHVEVFDSVEKKYIANWH